MKGKRNTTDEIYRSYGQRIAEEERGRHLPGREHFRGEFSPMEAAVWAAGGQ